MLAQSEAFSGFAVPDIAETRNFYGDTLGLDVEVLDEQNGLLVLHLAGGRDTFVYQKPRPVPASHTILNFRVDDIDAAVDELAARGVEFERYEGWQHDDK